MADDREPVNKLQLSKKSSDPLIYTAVTQDNSLFLPGDLHGLQYKIKKSSLFDQNNSLFKMNQIISLLLVSFSSVSSAGINISIVNSTAFILKESYQFGNLIEGAAVNPSGEIFATHFGNPGFTNKLGKIGENSSLFYENLEDKTSYYNAIRFEGSSIAYVADVKNHRISKLNIDGNKVTSKSVFCENKDMLQPNDFVLTKDGVIFTSGQRWAQDTGPEDGEIWVCSPGDSKAIKLGPVSGRTNGIALSPNDEYLYITESNLKGGTPENVDIFRYKVKNNKLSERTKFLDVAALERTLPEKFNNEKSKLATADIDGIRTDVDGNLYITRNGAGIVLVVNPQGEMIKLIQLKFSNPSSLEFGGPDGTTLYIVGRCPESTWNSGPGCVDTYHNDKAGYIWSTLQSSNTSKQTSNMAKCRQPLEI